MKYSIWQCFKDRNHEFKRHFGCGNGFGQSQKYQIVMIQ